MIKHIVFWKINKDGTDSDRRATVEAFRKKTEYLQTIIPQIKSATVGYNVNEGDVFHVCILRRLINLQMSGLKNSLLPMTLI